MQRLVLSLTDLVLVGIATILAVLVRDDFYFYIYSIPRALNYISVTLAVAAVVNITIGISRGMWRFTTFSDLLRLMLAAALTVGATTLIVFWINRLDGVSRSLPLLQFVFLAGCLAASRAIARLWHLRRSHRGMANQTVVIGHSSNVLVVGVNALTDLYIRSVEQMAAHSIHIAGVVGNKDKQTQRSLRQYQILGPVENIARLLLDLEVHGVSIDRIVVTQTASSLSEEALEELLNIENISDIQLEFIAERLGFENSSDNNGKSSNTTPPSFVVAEAAKDVAGGLYPVVKRFLDFSAAATLLTLLSPVICTVWMLVALGIGSPVLFWQRRPGLHGRNFKLYKFRTLGPGHAPNGRKLTDEERMSRIGQFLRNTRLDELPQLFNILAGEMSFVGPRPLLPVDQPEQFQMRLAVRPGLTGWAQVNGGRLVSAEDKGAMDVYYVRNMSLLLDLSVVLKTVPMVLFRERTNDEAVILAWKHLKDIGLAANASRSNLA